MSENLYKEENNKVSEQNLSGAVKPQRSKSVLPGIIAVIIAVLFLTVGSFKIYKVYDKDSEEYGITAFLKVPEKQLVEDATFSGTIRDHEKGKLYSTYDRSKPRGKMKCPT